MPVPSSRAGSVAISPDGTRLAYASGRPAKLFIRRLDQSKATELPGTEGAIGPFFSPDGRWLAFLDGRDVLNKISVEGGAVVTLGIVNVPSLHGASWGENGNIFVSDYRGLVRIPVGGGAPETIAGLDSGEPWPEYPQSLPGGKAILFSTRRGTDIDKFAIEVLTLANRHRTIVVRGGQSPLYLSTLNGTGHLAYVNKAALYAIPFDLEKLETRGPAVPILDDVGYELSSGVGQYDISRTGTLVYRRPGKGGAGMMTVQWVDPIGRTEVLRATPTVYRYVSVSPDGKRVALIVNERGAEDAWVYDPQRDAMTRITFGGARYGYIRWSPNGQHIVFGVLGKGIFQARADGRSRPVPLIEGKTELFPWSFTPDGKRMAYSDLGVRNFQIWTVPLEDHEGQLRAGTPEQLKSNFYDLNPSFSPDGRWLAYESNESGNFEVYVRAFPLSSQGGKWQISSGGGKWVFWSGNGHDVLFRSDDRIMAVRYTIKGETFVTEKPRVWIAGLPSVVWDPAPDGKRVAVLSPVKTADEAKQQHEVVFMFNFFDELRRRTSGSGR